MAFNSRAINLVTGDYGENDDVFLHDRQTNSTELISKASNGDQRGAIYHSLSPGVCRQVPGVCFKRGQP